MEIRAKAKFIRISAKKTRLVVGLIRGLGVEEALIQLQFLNKGAALPLSKLIKSAISNAEENHKLEKSNLYIKEARVDEGPVLKRWLPKAFGRATPIRKRSSHFIITLAERVPTDAKIISKAKEEREKANKSEIIKIEDFDQLKEVEKDDIKTEKVVAKEKTGTTGSKNSKGFVKNIFNRKSG